MSYLLGRGVCEKWWFQTLSYLARLDHHYMTSKATIVGGGIMGLCTAYYLGKKGWEVQIFDQNPVLDNCSTGNAGYICPSHFIPLAAPGIVSQGLRWMLNSSSPFYVQPRLNWGLIDWGLKFMKSATKRNVDQAAQPLCDLHMLSLAAYDAMRQDEGFDFFYAKKGMIETVQSPENAHHARETAQKAQDLGLDAEWLDYEAVAALEPELKMNIRGGIFFRCDAHCDPSELMQNLSAKIQAQGGQIHKGVEVLDFVKEKQVIKVVKTSAGNFETDLLVVTTGSWSREMAAKLGLNLPLVAGRGYSFLVDQAQFPVRHPIILTEGRVALSPFQNQVRFGGTMEIVKTGTPLRPKRVRGIVAAVRDFFPNFDLKVPPMEQVWSGYRPCSADGLPYIGRVKNYHNVLISTGHAMMGLSLGAASGQLLAEMANEENLSMEVGAFDPQRFG
jgi:D-amino-acid dehydrogenase